MLFQDHFLRAQVSSSGIRRARCPDSDLLLYLQSMLLYLHREGKTNKVPSQVSFKLLLKLFRKQLYFRTSFRSIKSQWSFFVEILMLTIFVKQTPSQVFKWILNFPLSLDGYCLHGLNSLFVLIVVPECFKNLIEMQQFQEYDVVQDCSFKKILSLKFTIAFLFLTQIIFIIVFQNSIFGFKIELFMKSLSVFLRIQSECGKYGPQ